MVAHDFTFSVLQTYSATIAIESNVGDKDHFLVWFCHVVKVYWFTKSYVLELNVQI